MLLDTAVVTILGATVALAFPDATYVRPGVGDLLIKQLQPFFPTIGIMLVTLEWGDERAYATFETAKLLAALNIDDIVLTEIDLSRPPEVEEELPF